MGLYLLNISVDTTGTYPEQVSEDLSFNDQESIIEIIVEQFLGYENAIKEYDDHEPEDHNKKKNVKIELLVHHSISKEGAQQITEMKKSLTDYESRLKNRFKDLDSPPPKV